MINHLQILETCLCAEDLTAIRPFYEVVMGLEVVDYHEGRHLFFRCGRGMLLIFNPQHTAHQHTDVNGQIMPLHGTHGEGHVAFAVSPEEIPSWKDRLLGSDVEIESEIRWPNGALSIYFRDPAGNSVELATPDLWGLDD